MGAHWADQSGATSVEYGVLLAFAVIYVVVIVKAVSDGLIDTLTNLATSMVF